MPRKQNLANLRTEKDGILILKEKLDQFYVPDSDEWKRLYNLLGIDYSKYSRSVDGVILSVEGIDSVQGEEDVLLVEVKTTKAKSAINLPYGAFFGITANEEELFKSKPNFRLCIVHTVTRQYCLITYDEYLELIQNKRVQYQVNFKTKNISP